MAGNHFSSTGLYDVIRVLGGLERNECRTYKCSSGQHLLSRPASRGAGTTSSIAPTRTITAPAAAARNGISDGSARNADFAGRPCRLRKQDTTTSALAAALQQPARELPPARQTSDAIPGCKRKGASYSC